MRALFRRDRPVPFEAPQPRGLPGAAAGVKAPEQKSCRAPEQATHESGIRGTFRPIVLNNTACPLPRRRSHRTPQRFAGDVPENPAGLCAHLRSPAPPCARGCTSRSPPCPNRHCAARRGMAHPRRPIKPERRIANVGAIVATGRPCSGARSSSSSRRSGTPPSKRRRWLDLFPLRSALEEAFATVQTSVLEALPETPATAGGSPPQPVQAGTLNEDQKARYNI